MGLDSTLYRIILLLHITTAIVGFGGIVAHGAYHARAFRSAAANARPVLEVTRQVGKIAEYAIYAVLPLGIVLISISDDTFSMGDAWVSASFVVWFLMVGAMHGAIRPAVKTMAQRAGAMDGDTILDTDDEAKDAARKLTIGEAATQLLVVVALVLMIWKPGT